MIMYVFVIPFTMAPSVARIFFFFNRLQYQKMLYLKRTMDELSAKVEQLLMLKNRANDLHTMGLLTVILLPFFVAALTLLFVNADYTLSGCTGCGLALGDNVMLLLAVVIYSLLGVWGVRRCTNYLDALGIVEELALSFKIGLFVGIPGFALEIFVPSGLTAFMFSWVVNLTWFLIFNVQCYYQLYQCWESGSIDASIKNELENIKQKNGG